jgi:hypothetical protein
MSDLRGAAPEPPALARWVDDPAIRDATLLTHNPSNAVTGGIWRVALDDGTTAVVKVITRGTDHTGHAGWAASEDPHHFNYWRREVEVYRADLPRWFRPCGLGAPAVLRLDERDDGVAVLWLEDIAGRTAGELDVADLIEVARRLGRVHAGFADGGPNADVRSLPWLSRGFLASYPESKYTLDELDTALADDQAWAHPVVARHLGALRDGLTALHRDRARLYGIAAACPRTLAHLDLWPSNIIARASGGFALVDWSFCGDGALGEDIANLVPDTVFDLLLSRDVLADLARDAERAYVDGLRDAGWNGDERWVRLGIRAAAAKYHWLFRRLVVSPEAPAIVYGGREVDVEDLYAARAAGLALLVGWADEARRLAADLGV